MKKMISVLLGVCVLMGLATALAGDGTRKAPDEKVSGVPVDLAFGANHKAFLNGIKGSGKLTVTFNTTMGNIGCELYEDRAPQAVLNFVGLARGLKAFQDPTTKENTTKRFYDGIAFHRVIPNFMVQIGDPTGTGRYNPGYGFETENHPSLKFDKPGILGMANAGPGTNGSQFFITEIATPWLDGKHTVFGQCQNLNVIKNIARVPTAAGNKPLTPIKITKVTFARVP